MPEVSSIFDVGGVADDGTDRADSDTIFPSASNEIWLLRYCCARKPAAHSESGSPSTLKLTLAALVVARAPSSAEHMASASPG
eukprot:1636396-Prymnesium_polylepis.1